MTRSSLKGRPTLGEVIMKETERNIVDGKQGTSKTFGGRATPKLGAQR